VGSWAERLAAPLAGRRKECGAVLCCKKRDEHDHRATLLEAENDQARKVDINSAQQVEPRDLEEFEVPFHPMNWLSMDAPSVNCMCLWQSAPRL